MANLDTKGQPIGYSQVRELVDDNGETICTGTLSECQAAANRRGLIVGVNCMIKNIWSL